MHPKRDNRAPAKRKRGSQPFPNGNMMKEMLFYDIVDTKASVGFYKELKIDSILGNDLHNDLYGRKDFCNG